MQMEIRETITDRMLLLSDILHYAPQAAEELFSALDTEEQSALLALLEKLTDKAESIFAGSRSEAPSGGFELDGDGLICHECELLCRISWTDDGTVSGARCQLGLKAADIARSQAGGTGME